MVAATVVAGLALSAAGASGERVVEIVTIVTIGLAVAIGWPPLVAPRSHVGMTVVLAVTALALGAALALSLIHISEPTRRLRGSRMPSSA